jgi:hypothetical protein
LRRYVKQRNGVVHNKKGSDNNERRKYDGEIEGRGHDLIAPIRFAGSLIAGNVPHHGIADAEIKQPEIARKRTDQNPDAQGRLTDFAQNVGH